jgi:hypothetical protein
VLIKSLFCSGGFTGGFGGGTPLEKIRSVAVNPPHQLILLSIKTWIIKFELFVKV